MGAKWLVQLLLQKGIDPQLGRDQLNLLQEVRKDDYLATIMRHERLRGKTARLCLKPRIARDTGTASCHQVINTKCSATFSASRFHLEIEKNRYT